MFNCDFFLIIFYVHLLLYSLCCKVEHRVKTVSQILFFAYIEVNYFTRRRIVLMHSFAEGKNQPHLFRTVRFPNQHDNANAGQN